MHTTRSVVVLAFALAILALTATAQEADAPPGDKPFDWLKMGNFRPYIEAGYGGAILDQKLFTAGLPTLGVAELRFGYREMKPYKSWGYKLDDRSLSGSYGSTQMMFGKAGSGEGEQYWRVAAGRKDGYGYDIAFAKFILHHGYSFSLTGLTMDSYGAISSADSAILQRYNGQTNFSLSTEPGITAEMFGFLSVSAGYEATVVYPRVVFPQWFVSYLLASSSIVLVSGFAEDIVNLSPVLGPALYFVLRNAVALAFAYAWRSDMNWPFPSETPLMTHLVKVNVGIQF
jgi:hypothetical protein